MKTTVSHSEVERYLRCERSHYYSYGLEIQSTGMGMALKRGIAGHTVLESYYETLKSGQDFDVAVVHAQAKWAALITEDPSLAPLLLEVQGPLMFFMTEWFPKQGWEVLATEYRHELPITEELQMPFVIDLAVRDRWGSIGVLDMKFQYDFFNEKDMELLPQLPKYVAGLQALGIDVAFAGYLLFRYRGRKDDSPSDRFRFETLAIDDTRLARTFEEQVEASDRILALRSLPIEVWSKKALRVFNNKTCESCPFRQLCSAELNGEDAQLVLDSFYKKKERREDVNQSQSAS